MDFFWPFSPSKAAGAAAAEPGGNGTGNTINSGGMGAPVSSIGRPLPVGGS